MAQRVLLRPGSLRVSYPGVDAVSASPSQLIFSSDSVSLAGAVTGELVFEASPLGGPQNTYQPVVRSVALPAGTGIPFLFIWNVRQDLNRTGYTDGSMLIYFDGAQQNVIFESRSEVSSHIGFMLHRNRSQ